MGPSSHCHRKSCTAVSLALPHLLVLRSASSPHTLLRSPLSPFGFRFPHTAPRFLSASFCSLSFQSALSSSLRIRTLLPLKAPVFPHIENCTGSAILTRYLSHFAFRFRSTASPRFPVPRLLFACLRSSPRPISISKLPCYHAFTADLSTLSSARGLTSLRYGSLFLEVGFTLRCLQRLSAPYFASLLCRWHDNSCTSGTSIPVLSY